MCDIKQKDILPIVYDDRFHSNDLLVKIVEYINKILFNNKILGCELKSISNATAPIIHATSSGNIASFADGADDMPVKKLTVAIEPVQEGSGDPSPENVRPITGWTKANVMRTGKNLLNHADTEIGIAWNGNSNSARARLVIPCKPSTTYTLSMNGTLSVDNIYRIYSPVVPASSAGSELTNSLPNTFTTAANSAYIILSFTKNNITQSDIETLKLQLELGSTATPYEPYQSQTYTITFPTEAGTVYGGTLDVTNGELVVDRAYIKATTQNTNRNSATNWYVRSTDSLRDGANHAIKSNVFMEISGGISTTAPGVCFVNGSGALRFNTINEYDTVSDLLAEIPDIEFIYPLATSQTYHLTPTEVRTLLGQNNIWADCGAVEVEYPADTKMYIDNAISG